MKITYNGTEYELNCESAINSKCMTPILNKFEVGDVFATHGADRIVILQRNWVSPCDKNGKQFVLGGNGGPLNLYSPSPMNYDQTLKYLRDYKYRFIGNINKFTDETVSKGWDDDPEDY